MADTQTGETETALEVTDNSWYYYMLIDLDTINVRRLDAGLSALRL